jgi:tetratricopeptide (TPR) repeat protein
MDRIAMLTEFLAENPGDAFARYGLAMEYSKAGQIEAALAEFSKLLAQHPDYNAGYFMAAQTLAAASRNDEARKMLTDGIASAVRNGNQHAQSEMEACWPSWGEPLILFTSGAARSPTQHNCPVVSRPSASECRKKLLSRFFRAAAAAA